MRTIHPHQLPQRQENPCTTHEYAFYEGCLGYCSLVCLKCGWDKNDMEVRK